MCPLLSRSQSVSQSVFSQSMFGKWYLKEIILRPFPALPAMAAVSHRSNMSGSRGKAMFVGVLHDNHWKDEKLKQKGYRNLSRY